MDRKIIILVLSFAVLFSFFMPLFEWRSFEMSGLNYILSDNISSYKYFLVLIPFSSVLLFFGAACDEGFFLNKKLLYWLPLLTLLFIFTMRSINVSHQTISPDNGNIFSGIDLGFWLTLGFSMLLVFVKSRKYKNY
jgi:hypothetical protein